MGESDLGGGMDYSGDASLAGDPADAGSFGSGLDGMGYGGDLMGPEPGFFSFDEGGYGLGQMSNDVSASYSDAAAGNYAGEDPGASFMDFFSRNPFGKFAQALIGRQNPFAGSLIGMGRMAGSLSQNNSRGNALGNMGGLAGGMLGGALFGPVGAMVGGWGGSQIGQATGGNTPGYSGPSMGQAPGAQGGGGQSMGNLISGGLGALYQNYKNNQDMGGQIGALQNMYGPKSPYAQQLRQALERRDAAGGRRSQYGPREVELQAALANAYSRNAPTLAGLYNQKMQNRQNMLNTIGYGIQQAGGIKGIYGGLQGLFGGGGMEAIDPSGYGIGNTFDTGSFNDVMPDVWGG